MTWIPREVLELIRWSEPDQPDWKPGNAGQRGHLLRAFACALLFRSYPDQKNCNEDRWHSFNETAIQLTDSLRALGSQKHCAGIRFMAWCLKDLAPLDPDGIEGPFLGLALLSLSVDSPNLRERDIVALCDWIDKQVSKLLVEKQWWATRRYDWLLSTNHHDLKNDKWIELGRRLYQNAEAQDASDRSTWIALIGRSLTEE